MGAERFEESLAGPVPPSWRRAPSPRRPVWGWGPASRITYLNLLCGLLPRLVVLPQPPWVRKAGGPLRRTRAIHSRPGHTPSHQSHPPPPPHQSPPHPLPTRVTPTLPTRVIPFHPSTKVSEKPVCRGRQATHLRGLWGFPFTLAAMSGKHP